MSTNPRDEYTPTTDEVRDAAGPDGATAIESDAFDRWLAAHDREVAAAALEAAAGWIMTFPVIDDAAFTAEGLQRRARMIREGRTDA